jgi:hypothetical protein
MAFRWRDARPSKADADGTKRDTRDKNRSDRKQGKP